MKKLLIILILSMIATFGIAFFIGYQIGSQFEFTIQESAIK